jgi:hypothetical protein
MENSNSFDKEIAVLVDTTVKFLKYGAQLLSLDLKHPENDHFAFMVIAFCFRQMEHLKSLYTLYKNECFQDMQFIARSMLEGMVFLKWGYANKQIVPLKWKAYSWVTDYRLAMKHIAEGKGPDDETKQKIIAALNNYGQLFLKKSKTLLIDFKQDPFHGYWHIDENNKKITFFDLFKELQAETLVEIYEDLSDWVHWNITGLGKIITRTQNEFAFNYDSMRSTRYAFAAGLLSSFDSFYLLDNHFNLNQKVELNKMQEEYINHLNDAKKSNENTHKTMQ